MKKLKIDEFNFFVLFDNSKTLKRIFCRGYSCQNSHGLGNAFITANNTVVNKHSPQGGASMNNYPTDHKIDHPEKTVSTGRKEVFQ